MKQRVFIIHGWVGDPDRHWYPWLKRELESKGIEVTVPAMPNSANPKLEEWLNLMNKSIGVPDEQTYLVGHSLGVVTILRYLEALLGSQKVAGLVLVAGFVEHERYYKVFKNFLDWPLDYEKIKLTVNKKIIAVHSDNDPFIPMKNAEMLRDNLGAELIIVPHAWHFDESDGCTELPAARDALLNMMK